MNYELAEKLKDAGFPQKPNYLTTTFTKEDVKRVAREVSNGSGIIIPYSESYLPTLSELIEACGDGFQVLKRGGRIIWLAYMNGSTWIEGTTPEEAVANLWLALHHV